MKKTLYLCDCKIKWRTFKKIQDACNKANKETGPYPLHIDKVLWQMVKAKQIYVGFTKKPFDMLVMTKLPKNMIIKVIREG